MKEGTIIVEESKGRAVILKKIRVYKSGNAFIHLPYSLAKKFEGRVVKVVISELEV